MHNALIVMAPASTILLVGLAADCLAVHLVGVEPVGSHLDEPISEALSRLEKSFALLPGPVSSWTVLDLRFLAAKP